MSGKCSKSCAFSEAAFYDLVERYIPAGVQYKHLDKKIRAVPSDFEVPTRIENKNIELTQ
ncbi:hypothetical protein RhiirA4_482297 [Rhizophagus irregularis]|uniref:Uncharacterized protein n=1 Tax=Rhizophagus irregularis TaxID=588596 RepID=A0A2I1HKV5_9GLOM|nr:hypothetical protein RhiirA4_482297 [Rhizophagus irregularis]